MRARLLPLALLALALSACRSPEATRVRGGGPGADIGNRRGAVDLHGKTQVYHGTPKKAGPR